MQYSDCDQAFWKGNTAGICLYGSFSAVQFWTFDQVRHFLPVGPAGGLAAMAATLCTYPFDLIRTRMALQASHPEIYGSVSRTIKNIVRNEGPTGFYKGILPSVAQVVPYMGISFYVHDKSKAALSSLQLANSTSDFASGALAGVVSKTAMMPVDVIRKRLQIQGSEYKAYALKCLPRYNGILDCIRTMWAVEGINGFYKGLTLAILKSGPATATTFLVYGLLN